MNIRAECVLPRRKKHSRINPPTSVSPLCASALGGPASAFPSLTLKSALMICGIALRYARTSLAGELTRARGETLAHILHTVNGSWPIAGRVATRAIEKFPRGPNCKNGCLSCLVRIVFHRDGLENRPVAFPRGEKLGWTRVRALISGAAGFIHSIGIYLSRDTRKRVRDSYDACSRYALGARARASFPSVLSSRARSWTFTSLEHLLENASSPGGPVLNGADHLVNLFHADTITVEEPRRFQLPVITALGNRVKQV